jgi:putative spermidine/putrescine transport system ATP-binding protein
MESDTSMVRIEGLTKRYGDFVALDSADLSINEGEFVSLLGPSGSGKTTLLNLIAGLIQPTQGRVWIKEIDVTRIPPNRRGLGMVFQNYALMPHMTVYQNIAFPFEVRRLPKAEIVSKVREVLDLIRLPAVGGRKPKELSGGQQQRIALARALVYNPAIILMDEPLGALDKKLREQMQLELKRLHTQLGITLLYVTHDQEEALTMSDRVVLLNGGRIAQIGPPSDIYFNPRSVFAADFLGDSNMMEAVVMSAAEATVVATPAGRIFRAKKSSFAEAGMTVKVMVRPENVAVLRGGDDALANAVEGEVLDSLILGGVVKHHIWLDEETTVVALELNRIGASSLAPKSYVKLGWTEANMLVLPINGAM